MDRVDRDDDKAEELSLIDRRTAGQRQLRKYVLKVEKRQRKERYAERMHSKKGNILIGLGIIFILLALALVVRNRMEDMNAGQEADRILTKIVEAKESADTKNENEGADESVPDPYDPNMTEKEIDGIMYVGYLSIPSRQLELPIISQWSYDYLKISPCRLSGSSKTDDLVIMAHNYKRHFGPIRDLQPGEEVILTDMDGVVTRYEVVTTEILGPKAVADMTSGEYDLSLFTCNYGGKSRVTIRCDRA